MPSETSQTSVADDFACWRGGDPEGLTRLVRRLTPRLWHVARAYGLGPATAEDAVQLAWVTLVRQGDAIREPQAVSSWLTTVTRREAARLARSSSRELPTDDQTSLDGPGHEAGPLETVVVSAEARSLWRNVATLSERCRRLLRVIAFSDRPDYGGISRDLGMPMGSIGPTRRRCLEKLRLALSRDPLWRES